MEKHLIKWYTLVILNVNNIFCYGNTIITVVDGYFSFK